MLVGHSVPTQNQHFRLSQGVKQVVKPKKKEKPAENQQVIFNSCGNCWIRTSDPLLVRQVL